EELEPGGAEELRVAVLWMRELGVNPAGVDVALQLRRRLLALEARLHDALKQPGKRWGARAAARADPPEKVQAGRALGTFSNTFDFSLASRAAEALELNVVENKGV